MNKPKSKGMSPVMKGGLACCAILALLIAGSCGLMFFYADELAKWAGNMASTDGPTVRARYTAIVGAELPEDTQPKFSVDTTPLPLAVSFASAKNPNELTLIAVRMPEDNSQPMPEEQMAWMKVVAPFGPQMPQHGVSLPTGEAHMISETGASEEQVIEVDGKKFKAVVTPCKHSDGTELKRVYVKLKGEGYVGLFAIGSKEDFDQDLLEEALKGTNPR